MKQNKNTFKNDITVSECIALSVSVVGIISALGCIAFALWSI
mgnify:FL=1